MKTMEQEHRTQLGQSSERQKALEATISRLQSEINRLCMLISAKDNQIDRLNRVAYPRRYRLSSGAELERIFVPNYLNPSQHIWTRVETSVSMI